MYEPASSNRPETPAGEQSPPADGLPRFTLRGALIANALVGVILSIPLLGVGFALMAGILVVLCALQLPFFLLFGAFHPAASAAQDEWDRWREEGTKP